MAAAQDAMALAQSGCGGEAVALLETATDGDALALLGLWRLEGRLCPRDPVAARECLRRAAELGNAGAARICTGFVATGTGGAADWRAAVALLGDWADRDPLAARQRDLIAAMVLTADGAPVATFEGEEVSSAPEIVRFADLFSIDECRFLIDVSRTRFKPAQIFHEGKGRFVKDPVRRSDSAGFPLTAEWPLVHALNRRIAAASGTHVRQGEPLQLLRYRPGERYSPHLDAVPGMTNQRRLTALVWLNEDYDGGETRFLETGLALRGQTGDAIVFRNALYDGRPDPTSRHEGCPVTRGEKLMASRWIRERPAGDGAAFGPEDAA